MHLIMLCEDDNSTAAAHGRCIRADQSQALFATGLLARTRTHMTLPFLANLNGSLTSL